MDKQNADGFGAGGISPDLSAEELAQMAHDQPELWPQILVHPNVYEGLQQWITANQSELDAEWSDHADHEQPHDEQPHYEQLNFEQPQWPSTPEWQPSTDVAPEFETPEFETPGYPAADYTAPDYATASAATAYMPAQGDTQAFETAAEEPAKPRSKRTIIIAASLAAVLALGGAGTALALTDTWPFGSGGGAGGSSDAATVSNAGPSFGAGIEKKWQFTSDDLEVAGHMGGMPRMMVNYVPRSQQPQQIDGAVIFHTRATNMEADAAGQMISVVDAATGEVTWEDRAEEVSCVPGEGTSELVCVLGYSSESDLISITQEGVFDIGTVSGLGTSLHRAGDGYVLGGPGTIRGLDQTGEISWTADETGESSTELLQVAGEYVLGVSSDGWRVLGKGGKTLVEESGLDSTNVNASDRCDFMLTEKKLLMIGTACDDSIEIDGLASEVVSYGNAMSIGLLADSAHQPKTWLHSLDGTTTAYDAVSGDELWSTEGMIPGWFQAPQLVASGSDSDAGDGVLLVRDDEAIVANVDAGGEATLLAGADGSGSGRMLAVSSGTVLSFDWEAEEVTAYDGISGEELSLGTATKSHDFLETTGGRNGALAAIPVCSDCSTADGASTVAGYEFFGPIMGDSSGGVTPAGNIAVPEFIPDCPASTEMLAWAELEDGWVVVCGVSADAPSYVAYRPSTGGETVYSAGSKTPSGAEAKSAVVWDDRLSRYSAELVDGKHLTFDYDIGTLTIRDSLNLTTLDQERLVRYLFVVKGNKIRTMEQITEDDGAFAVKAPKDTAEDQIRYMVEVLEKAYDGRALVKDALPKLEKCMASAGGYGDSVAAMKAVRDNRAELLDSLAAMPVDKIPEGQALLDDLNEAIRYSYQANIEYVAWAEAANTHGCASLSGAGYTAAAASDAPKERFASRWNSVVAPSYGVRTFDAWYI